MTQFYIAGSQENLCIDIFVSSVVTNPRKENKNPILDSEFQRKGKFIPYFFSLLLVFYIL